ncbi:MAG: hypothetical protein H6553_05000 [Chitinophagales bacterium]|nr:hypothetical protein [Chitinophagales bacterium]
MNSDKTIKIAMILLLVAIAISSRLLQVIPNFAPIGAIALLFGAYLQSSKKAILLTFLTMFIADVSLAFLNGYPVFYNSMIFVYLAFFIIVLLGSVLKNRQKNILNISVTAVSSSLIFFIVSNFGVWLMSGMYAKNSQGLIDCFIMGIPFYKYTFISDIAFAISFFMLWKLAFSLNESKTAKSIAQ